MLKQKLFRELFALIVLIGILNFFATKYNWYWSLQPFDSFMHFLGGAWSALFFMWFYFYSGVFRSVRRNLSHFLKVSILGVVFIAVSWEIYELLLGEARLHAATYSLDTATDLLLDLLGALVACFYAYFLELENKNHNNQQ